MSGHEEMLRIPTHLYPSTKILPHLTQSRHNRNNKMLLLLLFLPLLVCFVLVFAFSCVCVSFPFFLFLFCAVCVSICFYPSIFSDSFGWLISDFLISSFPRADNPTNPTRLKKTMTGFLRGIVTERKQRKMPTMSQIQDRNVQEIKCPRFIVSPREHLRGCCVPLLGINCLRALNSVRKFLFTPREKQL